MKRSQIRPGAKSLQRGSTFKPPRRRKPLTVSEREQSRAWASGAHSARCVLCGARWPSAHHIVTRQRLCAKAAELGVPAARLLWDRRNRLWLCGEDAERRGCHAAHHSRSRPVTWRELQAHAPKVFQFARELGLLPWLERMYPQDNEAGGRNP